MTTGPNDPDKTGSSDNTEQLIKLLNSLELLPAPGSTPPTGTFEVGDKDFQVLKAGVTKITSWVSRIIAAAGGAGAVWAAVEAYFNHSRPGLQITLVAAAAAIVGLAALSLALVIGSDLRARAVGTAAMYEARGQVAAAFEALQGFQLATAPAVAPAGIAPAAVAAPQAASQTEAVTAPAPAAPPAAWSGDLPISVLALATSGTQVRARVKDSDGDELYVTGVRYKNGSLKVRLTAQAVEPSEVGSWYDVSAIDEFDTTS
ncbi:MAG: hypothetical protein ACRDOB_25010 [Streptosporangiaceae bacterium]